MAKNIFLKKIAAISCALVFFTQFGLPSLNTFATTNSGTSSTTEATKTITTANGNSTNISEGLNKEFAATSNQVSYNVTGDSMTGGIIDIAVNVSYISNLYGASVDFLYDTSLIEVQSITQGSLFTNKISAPTVQKVANGQANIAMTLSNSVIPISGGGSIAVIQAKVLKAGTVNLKTTETSNSLSLSGFTTCVKLADNLGSKIGYTFLDNSITTTSVPVVINSITSDKTSPQAANTPITFTANATSAGNSSILYQFWVNDSSGWKMVQNYSTSNTFTWTPSVNCAYSISVYAKDVNSTNIADSVKIIPFIIKTITPVVVNSITANKTSPQSVYTPITFTANATGGSSLLYQFWVNDSSGWKMVRNYGTSNTFTWTPPANGNYSISVYARDVSSTNIADSLKITSFAISGTAPVVVNSITANKTSPQAVNTPITFTANATGGSSLIYQFWINDSSGWKMVRNYSSSNTFTWTPSTNGTYSISVYAKDVNSTYIADSLKVTSFAITGISSVLVNSLTSNKTSPQAAGTPITFTANATGSSSMIYQFWVNDSSGWKSVGNYSTSNTFTWTPPTSGTYSISVYAKDINSINVADSLKVTSFVINGTASVLVNSLIGNKVSPQAAGTPITFTANATGSSSIIYQFWVNDSSGWKAVGNYSTSNTFTWTPPTNGYYSISVYAKDINSTNIADSLKVISFTIS